MVVFAVLFAWCILLNGSDFAAMQGGIAIDLEVSGSEFIPYVPWVSLGIYAVVFLLIRRDEKRWRKWTCFAAITLFCNTIVAYPIWIYHRGVHRIPLQSEPSRELQLGFESHFQVETNWYSNSREGRIVAVSKVDFSKDMESYLKQAELDQVERESIDGVLADAVMAGVTKVVGYRFEIPGEDNNGFSQSGSFTLLQDGAVDLTLLETIKNREVNLDTESVRILLECLRADAPAFPPVACYSPHQVFVFYASDETVKQVVEVCFLCNGIRTSPQISGMKRGKQDLVRLAHLCSDLGIWSTFRAPESYQPVGWGSGGWGPSKVDQEGEQRDSADDE